MASLKEIARESGVSIRTVARALSDAPNVRDEVRLRVRRVAERLGHAPDRVARSLRNRKSFEIAVAAWSHDELHVARMAGMEPVFRQAGYNLSVMFDLTADTGSVVRMSREIVARRPAAAVLFGPPGESVVDLARPILGAGIPCVALDSSEPSLDRVEIDRQQGIYEAVRHLASSGRSRIAYLGKPDPSRLRGYLRAMEEAGLEPSMLPLALKPGFEAGRAAARVFDRDGTDAVQAFSDVVALGFLYGLHNAGVRVPQEVALVGFDDRLAAATCWPGLTTVAQPSLEVGRAAAEIALERIGGDISGETKVRVLPTKFVERETT